MFVGVFLLKIEPLCDREDDFVDDTGEESEDEDLLLADRLEL